MRKALSALLLFVSILSLVTVSPVNSEEHELWLPERFDWYDSYSMICEAFYGKVYETPPVIREKGTYTGIMASETSQGFIFTFCDDKLVGLCVAYGASDAKTPSMSDIDSIDGYTKTYESRSGNWIYVESGLKGYEILNWENNIGIRSNKQASN